MRSWILILCFLGGAGTSAARAAELFYMDHDAFTRRYVGPVGPLVLSGDIVPGDYAQLLAKIAHDGDRFFGSNTLIVASPSGDMAEAIKIATLVARLHAVVSVGPQTGVCVGACFLIFAAADQRNVDGAHLLGIQAEADPAPGREFLVRSQVPAALIEHAWKQPPGSVYWLSEADEADLGDRSPGFTHYLAAQCGWDPVLEHEIMAGRRPLSEMQSQWACRARITRNDARNALAAALKSAAPH